MVNREMESPIENSVSLGWYLRHPVETFSGVKKSLQGSNNTESAKCFLIDYGVMLASWIPTVAVISLKGPTPEGFVVGTLSTGLSVMAFGAGTYRFKQILEGYSNYLGELLAKTP